MSEYYEFIKEIKGVKGAVIGSFLHFLYVCVHIYVYIYIYKNGKK